VTRSTTSSPSLRRPDTQTHPTDSGGVGDSALLELMTRLRRAFADFELLEQAVSHRSWCAEAGGSPSNERLEFLGDAVLGLVVADYLFRTYPASNEGDMAQVRAAVVNTNVLAEIAAGLDLGQALRLGRGEEASGGRMKPSILADAFEAVIGAVYLDGGWDAAAPFVLDMLGSRIATAAAGPGADDHKTRLQELVVRIHGQAPRYEVVGSGPDHDRRFNAKVYVAGNLAGDGDGRSKKDAEQAAARVAWGGLNQDRQSSHSEASAQSDRSESGDPAEALVPDA
jgi:ribonuclease III